MRESLCRGRMLVIVVVVCAVQVATMVGVAAVPQPAHASSDGDRAKVLSYAVVLTMANAYQSSNGDSVVPAATAERDALLANLRELNTIARNSTSMTATERSAIFGGVKVAVDAFPALLRSGQNVSGTAQPIVLDPVQKPYAAIVRAAVNGVLRDAGSSRSGLISAIVLPAHRAQIYTDHGVLVLDNNGLSDTQLDVVDRFLARIDSSLWSIKGITANGPLGTPAEDWTLLLGGVPGDINIDHGPLPSVALDQFPPDAPSSAKIPQFCSVLQHEINHNVDATAVVPDARLNSRRSQLISRAGADPMQYLRSMYVDTDDEDQDGNTTESLFPIFPQELVASISNEYLADSQKTLELGLKRFRDGYREPINQFIFFADIYSRGGLTTTVYEQDTNCNLVAKTATLTRDSRGNINSITFGDDGFYRFRLDNGGNVTSLSAGDVSVSGSDLKLSGTALDSHVSISQSETTINFYDSDGLLSAGTGCSYVFWGVVGCSKAGISRVVVDAKAGDDRIDYGANIPASVHGESGDDTLTGGPSSDLISGGPGSDQLKGGGGIDWLQGDGGNDTLDGGSGTELDALVGGSDTDTASYASRAQPVEVDLRSGVGGRAGEEADAVVGIENIGGGAGSDLLFGNDMANTLHGGAGSDRIHGEGGQDALYGDAGTDLLDGGNGGENDAFFGDSADWLDYSSRSAGVAVSGAGASGTAGQAGELDLVYGGIANVLGGGGDDTLSGYEGTNILIGCGGNDTITGGAGFDLVGDEYQIQADGLALGGCSGGGQYNNFYVRDGQNDAVWCGPGLNDQVEADTAAFDYVLTSGPLACEGVIRP